MNRIRILIADDHTHVRHQILARLSRETDLEIVGEADNSSEVVEHGLAQQPHVLLIDPMMRDGLGLEAIRQVAARLPNTGVVVLTAFSDTALQIDLRRIGVCHILDKGIDSGRLIAILRDVGRTCLPPYTSVQDHV